MNRFQKIVVAALIVLAVELGALCIVAARFVNGVTVEVVEGE